MMKTKSCYIRIFFVLVLVLAGISFNFKGIMAGEQDVPGLLSGNE